MKTTVILGAGFSKNSGLPVQSGIPERLIAEYPDNSFEQAVSGVLKRFMMEVFGYEEGENIPELDDLFTCIDISTNSGHHLGIRYSPVQLRAVRRFLVYRVFSILEKDFTFSSTVEKLIGILHQHYAQTRYIVLNWDTVLEKYLARLFPQVTIDYCNGGVPLKAVKRGKSSGAIKVIKTHGSLNWLYCDNCRSLINDDSNLTSIRERAGFEKNDFELSEEFDFGSDERKEREEAICTICGNRVSSHIATFSYRKSFRANSFPSIWNEAEAVLSDSDRWIFIGYSLPEADFEFKHLLKIAELKLAHKREVPLKIDAVVGADKSTASRYEKFFGSKMISIYTEGIKGYLNSMG